MAQKDGRSRRESESEREKGLDQRPDRICTVSCDKLMVSATSRRLDKRVKVVA